MSGSSPRAPRRVGHHRVPFAARARRGERGAVLMMVTLSMTIIATCTALTVDLGRVSTLRRDLQNVADAAALDLARALDGETAAIDLVALPAWEQAVEATLARNGFGEGPEQAVEVAVGSYDPVADVFTAYAGDGVPPPFLGDVPSAVRVRVSDRVDYAFAPGGATTSREAVASRSTPVAGIQIGSFAARIDAGQSSLLGPLLGALGGDAAVDLLSYQGLAGVSVGLDALATELGLSLADPDGLLSEELTVLELVEAQAAILERNGLLAEAEVLRSIALGVPNPSTPVVLGDLVAIASGGGAAAANAQVNVVDLITGAALVANDDSAVQVPGLGVGIPGVTALSAEATLVEKPRWVFGPPGTEVETAQVQLALDGTLLPAIGGTFAELLTLDLTVDVASGRGRIADILCGPDGDALDVGVLAELVTVSGSVTGSLLDVATVVVDVSTSRPPGGEAIVPFDFPPDEMGVAKQVGRTGGLLAAPTLDVDVDVDLDGWSRNQLQSLLSGLDDLGIDLDLLGLGDLLGGLLGLLTPLNVLKAAVEDVVDALVAELTSVALPAIFGSLDGLVDPLLSLLGITAPGADVAPLGLECGGLKLVV